ncbi:MAG: winged helix-turn-helix domain-containing protein [Bacteroidales bacterium]|nr:winged helix-turn-helix domain-containing protein [Bacteroidales bacterium]
MGRTKTLIDTSYSDVISMDIKNISDYEVIIKLKAIQASITHKESTVAEIFGIARSTLSRWISNYKKYGIEGCCSKSRGHNPSKLSLAQKETIRNWLTSGKDSQGRQVHWTLRRLIQEIALVFGKEITKTPLWITLHSMQLSLKKPRPQHYKADIAQQEDFKKNSRTD